jgi:hypothetical protein
MIICGVMYALECVLFILWRFYCEYPEPADSVAFPDK